MTFQTNTSLTSAIRGQVCGAFDIHRQHQNAGSDYDGDCYATINAWVRVQMKLNQTQAPYLQPDQAISLSAVKGELR